MNRGRWTPSGAGVWRLTMGVLVVGAGVAGCGEDEPPTTVPPLSEDPPGWQAFSIAGVQAERAASNVGFHEFLSEPALRMGIYHLPAGSTDGQEAHGQDEIYYVAGGSAKLSAGGVDYDAPAGSAFFVRAQVDHRFHSITEDLDVLVVFAAAPSSAASPEVLAFTSEDVVSARDGSANVWDPFLAVSTMSLGMYMLPAALGGDETLTHTFDEINIVVAGQGRFTVGEDTLSLQPGSIVYVERGEGHHFDSLTEDLDVLILWNR